MGGVGSGHRKGRPGIRPQTITILKMRECGMKQKTIADELGCSIYTVKQACRKYGMKVEQTKLTEAEAAETIHNAGYEYVSGFTNSHSKVTVRCMKCGGIFERMYKNLRDVAIGTYKNKMECPHCWRINIEEQRQIKRQIKRESKRCEARIKAEQRAKKEADLISRQTEERLAIHICKNCGVEYCIESTGYNSKQYCSEKCCKRWNMRVKNDRRLRRMKQKEHDTDITLEKLFKRDGGVCYLCGEMCEWNDIDEKMNAGGNYPSIDHVIPLSKGGKHLWENIKLAHRKCNTAKRDEISPYW